VTIGLENKEWPKESLLPIAQQQNLKVLQNKEKE
tara:strand:- start:423 stop:524 length:102 start_codon:yes stop_codon:yes gene_type:complete